uniref:protein-L-isoaspartate(D-aspartate) O-methyltransferase n=1 Tax=Trichobilharzia regenti TaxID=157069 RepID=A0AA85IR51_TRIRE|nr:unnamed protein product [Trichobilharzia regenti]
MIWVTNFKSLLIMAIIPHLFACASACQTDEAAHVRLVQKIGRLGFPNARFLQYLIYNVDRGCFVSENPYKNIQQSIGSGGIILAPSVHARILSALVTSTKRNSRALVIESGSGYLTACFSILTSHTGVTFSSQPNKELTDLARKNVEKWLKHKELGVKFGLELGKQIIFTSGGDKTAWSSNGLYDFIFVRTKDGSVVTELKKLLKREGRLVCLEGPDWGKQKLYLIRYSYYGTYQESFLMNVEYEAPPDKQSPVPPTSAPPAKPKEDTTSEDKETTDVSGKDTIYVPREESTDVREEDTIDSYAEEPFIEPGVFDPDYFSHTSIQVKHTPDSKVLFSLCISITLFMSLF